MRKEIIFALFAGIAFGLVVAFGVWRTNSNPEVTKKENSIQEKKTTEETKTQSSSNLAILKPEEYEVVSENKVNIEGITEPEAQIIISTEEKDFLITADKDGGFYFETPLIGGLNEIVITSFLKDKEKISVKLPVVYSQDFQK
jgi:sortase (surface protein transpeptidase)